MQAGTLLLGFQKRDLGGCHVPARQLSLCQGMLQESRTLLLRIPRVAEFLKQEGDQQRQLHFGASKGKEWASAFLRVLDSPQGKGILGRVEDGHSLQFGRLRRTAGLSPGSPNLLLKELLTIIII